MMPSLNAWRALALCGTFAVFTSSPAIAGAQTPIAPSAQDTFPIFQGATGATKDSVRLVDAANDALQGRFGVEVPMQVTSFRRSRGGAELTLQPIKTPNAVWLKLAGTVRILPDGRRVILRRF
jgi:hypothetical protein